MTIQVLHDTNPVARKQHRCSNCFRIIEPGETYNRQDNVGDDGRYTWKQCAHCEAIWSMMWRVDRDDLQYYDDGVDMHGWLIEKGQPELLKLFERQWLAAGALVAIPAFTADGTLATAALSAVGDGGGE